MRLKLSQNKVAFGGPKTQAKYVDLAEAVLLRTRGTPPKLAPLGPLSHLAPEKYPALNRLPTYV